MNRPTRPELPQKISPDMLLTNVENQARKTSYEQALGASAQFVSKLIEAGHLKTVEAAIEAFNKGVSILKMNMQKEMVELQMKEIEAYLPKVEENKQDA